MRKNLLLIIALLVSGFITAQSVRQSPALIDEGTETGSPSFQKNEVETDAMSIWALPSTGATSGNTRIPGNTYRYQRTEYLITSAEMAASSFPVGQEINSIGFLVGTAGATTQSGTFTVYLKNTSDVAYSLGTSWDLTGFTKVSEIANWTVPIAAGSYEVPFSGGSTFTYTGGGVYVAWEFSNPSGTLGTTALVALCNLNMTAGLMGQRSNTAMPTTLVASNWRPATIFGNTFYTDVIQVTNIYSLARNPIPYGAPTPIDVRVVNVSSAPATFNVTVTVKDPTNTFTRYTSTQTVTALAGNSASVLNFTGWNPTIKEEANIIVTTSAVAGENWTTNNTLTVPCSVNDNLYSYNYNNTGGSGFGFTYPGTGIFAAKYTMNGQGKVTGANLFLYNGAASTGNTIYAVVLNSAGTIVAQSADYVITAGDLGTNKNFTFPTPPVFTDEVYYIGLAQTAGTAQWYPMGIFTESPPRGNTFYETSITGGVLSPLDVSYAYKFGIEAIVAPNFSIPAITTVAASAVTATTATVNGTVMANSNTVAVSFEYGTTTAYGTTVSATPGSVTGTTVTPVLNNLSGLLPETTYHFRAIGTIGLFKFYGADLTFTTAAAPPTVITLSASNVDVSSATLNGTVNANNNTATVTFEYGLTTAYGSTVNATPATVNGTTVTAVSANLSSLLLTSTYHYRVVATNIGGTSYGADMTFTTGCIPPAAAGLISGPATVCQGTTAVAYSVPAIAGATSYVWTLPTGATVATGSGTNSITVDFSGTAVSGDISVYGANDCSNGAAALLAVTLNPMPIPTLTAGALGVCVGSTGVVYQTQAGMTGYTWTISAGGTITAGAGTNAITVTWSAVGAQSIGLNYTNASLCAAPQPASFAVNVVPQPIPVISGPANACLGFATNVYSTQSGMTNYAWTLSAGGTITAGAGTNAISVTWNTLGAKTVSVNYTNTEGCSALTPTVYNVTVNPTPSPSISGVTELCAGSTDVVYTTQANYSNYVWNISYGGTITAGLATNEVVVNWATAGTRSISVNYNNALGCSSINASNLEVIVNSTPVPVISGTNQLCQGSTGVAYTTQANYDNYIWTVSSGGAVTSGAGTEAITVTWNESGNQTVSVSYTNGFGCAPTTPTVFNVTVDPKPAAAGTIIGTTPVCAGATMVTYTTAPIPGISTFLWTLPAGATIAEGANTRTIKVNFAANASSGIIKVSGVNDCGPGPSSPNFNVIVNPMPATPVITQNGDTLTSSANTGNQWYLDGVLIPGATGKQHVAVYTGTYTVVVTVNACGSAPSNGILVLPVSVNSDKANRTFDIYPNPNRGEFNIKVETLKSEEFNIEIYNSLGSMVWKQESVTVNGTFTTHVVLSESPSGMYMIKLRNNENTIVKKLIIKN
jgi:hypothetical protein